MENKDKFKKWLSDTKRPKAVSSYSSAVERVSAHYSEQTRDPVSIYEISSQAEISRIASFYKPGGKFAEKGSEGGSKLRTAITRYSEFFAGLNVTDYVSSQGDADVPQEPTDGQQSNFKYEHDLQVAFCAQISELFPDYEVLDQQYPIKGKRIDVLLEHSKLQDLLVVELKSGKAGYPVFGQISMYIGLLSEMPKFSDRKICGAIVAGGATDGLLYACKTNPNISVKTYRMSIELEDSDLPDVEGETE